MSSLLLFRLFPFLGFWGLWALDWDLASGLAISLSKNYAHLKNRARNKPERLQYVEQNLTEKCYVSKFYLN